MVHKAKATCRNGHSMEFGPCNKEFTRFFLFKSVCTSTDHKVISAGEIQCQRCNTIHMARVCEKCGEHVPVTKFRQNTQIGRFKR
jgi:hypothetical protein